jgi:basic membrane protein A
VKKFIIALTGVVMVVVLLLGCMPGAAPTPPVTPPAKPVRVAVIWTSVDPAHSGGFDQGQYEGINKAFKEEHGWEVYHAEGIPYGRQAMATRSLADKGYDIIIFPDAGQAPAWNEVAPEYPNTWFIMTSYTETLPDAERVAAWSFDAYNYGAAAGAVAALLSKTNVIGVTTGEPIEILLVIMSGYIEGAKAIKPDIEVLYGFTGDWADVTKHKEVTEAQLAKGADVIFSPSSIGQKGTLEATTAAGVYAIGHMGDTYALGPETVVTSVAWDTAKTYGEIADKFLAGTLEKKITVVGLDGFELCDFRGLVPLEKETEIRDTFRKLQTGEIVVPKVTHEF